MIVAEQKPIEEIMAMIPPVDNLLVVGCDTCVTVCLAGGEKEVKVLSAAIRLSNKGIGTVNEASIERQCDREFLSELGAAAREAGAILSMACGAGIQMLSDAYPDKIVLPAVNTLFMGSNEDAGYWMERCLGCGDCVLDLTAGICPRTRCSKGLMNGPCGGSENGKCEVDPENIECGWNLIYQRLKSLNMLDRLMDIQPPQDWSKTHDGGPRRLIREDVKL
jgi:ferredoxin